MSKKRKAPSLGRANRAGKRCRAFYSINYSTKGEEKQEGIFEVVAEGLVLAVFMAVIVLAMLIVG